MMTETLKVIIHKIKAINHAEIELPFQSGLYAIVGNNGTGKSTFIYCLAQLINQNSLVSFGVDARDGDSYLEFIYKNERNRWDLLPSKNKEKNIYMKVPPNQIHINGMYEGSLFYGFRFKNFNTYELQ